MGSVLLVLAGLILGAVQPAASADTASAESLQFQADLFGQTGGVPGEPQATPTIAPATHDVSVAAGRAHRFTLEFATDFRLVSTESLDVAFLVDATLTASASLPQARQRAVELMRSLGAYSTDCRFAVASFSDYSAARVPFRLHAGLAADRRAAQAALARITPVDGGDLPEACSRALHEIRSLAWRPRSRRFLVLIGDAPAHDTDFFGYDFGPDPGRDGLVGTRDDLRFRDVARGLARDRITVMPLYEGVQRPGRDLLDPAVRGFRHLAKATGGRIQPLDAPDQVRAFVEDSAPPGHRAVPVVSVPPGYRSWLRVAGIARDLAYANRYTLDLELRPPPNTPDGFYRFPVAVHAANSGRVAAWCQITLRLGFLQRDWTAALPRAYAFGVAALLVLAFVWSLFRRGSGMLASAIERPAWPLIPLVFVVAAVCGYLIVLHWAPGRLPPVETTMPT